MNMQVPESSPASHQQRRSSKEFISNLRQATVSVHTKQQEERLRLSMGGVAQLDGPRAMVHTIPVLQTCIPSLLIYIGQD